MHIHAYEKLWLALALILILLLIGSVTYGAVGPGVAMVTDSENQIDAGGLDEDERFSEPRVEQVGENHYEAYVVAYQFAFEPTPIVVPEDSRVTLYVTSRDVVHGFEVVGTWSSSSGRTSQRSRRPQASCSAGHSQSRG